MDDIIQDLHFGFRVLQKRPVFASAAILTLAIGVGMTTTMFTLVDAVVLRPLAGTKADGMVYLSLKTADGEIETSPTPELLRLVRDHASSFSRVEAFADRDYAVEVDGEPLRVKGAMASTGFFSFLGIRPRLGRTFLPHDERGSTAPVVVLSHSFWQDRFAGSRGVLGRAIVIEGQTHQIVGVLPRDFRLDTLEEVLLWVPEGSAGELLTEGVPVEGALATLSPEVTVQAAESELAAIIRNNPLNRRADLDWVGDVRTPEELVDPSLKRALFLLQGGAILVLLVACGNLANLLLAQGEARARELAIRSSLGASRGRLTRQLLAETAILVALGGSGGILLTLWALTSLPLFLPPGYAGFALNGTVIVFATGASLLAILAAGLTPALMGSKRNLVEVIKGADVIGGGLPTKMRARRALVTAEVAMAFVLLASAGLLVKSLTGLMTRDLGFAREDLLTVRFELPEKAYEDEAVRMAFYLGLRDSLSASIPAQLGSATVANGLVENLSAVASPLVPEGTPEEDQENQIILTWKVAPDYFDVLDLPLIRGRGFREEDDERVVIINDEIARASFPGKDPVGRQIKLNGSWNRIIGVAASINLPALAQSRLRKLQLFVPFQHDVGTGYTIIARSGPDRAALIERIKEAVWVLDRSIPIMDVSLVEDALAQSLSQERSNAFLMLLFALTALTLGAVGIYGVMAYSVSRRIREMGIRLALGASRRGVVVRVVARGMRTVLAGMLVGGVGSLALGSLLAGFLVEVDPRDPAVFLLAALVTTMVALLATWLPARRAAGASPSDTLRAE